MLDIDYHHGNGQQEIFYTRSDVLTVSIHGHPSFAYPYFTGFRDETGIGPGAGYNLNLPLPEHITPEQHRNAVAEALRRVRRFAPAFLVVSAGFDTARGDPTGTWSNRARDFEQLGHMIGEQATRRSWCRRAAIACARSAPMCGISLQAWLPAIPLLARWRRRSREAPVSVRPLGTGSNGGAR